MAKRQDIIKTTVESEALKNIRIKNNLSIQKLADKMEVSKTRVAQMEGGRGNITEDYVEIFLGAIGIGWADWLSKIEASPECDDLQLKCHNIIDQLSVEELQKLFRFMNDYIVVSKTYY